MLPTKEAKVDPSPLFPICIEIPIIIAFFVGPPCARAALGLC
jgi:hypothetical protein